MAKSKEREKFACFINIVCCTCAPDLLYGTSKLKPVVFKTLIFFLNNLNPLNRWNYPALCLLLDFMSFFLSQHLSCTWSGGVRWSHAWKAKNAKSFLTSPAGPASPGIKSEPPKWAGHRDRLNRINPSSISSLVWLTFWEGIHWSPAVMYCTSLSGVLEIQSRQRLLLYDCWIRAISQPVNVKRLQE